MMNSSICAEQFYLRLKTSVIPFGLSVKIKAFENFYFSYMHSKHLLLALLVSDFGNGSNFYFFFLLGIQSSVFFKKN